MSQPNSPLLMKLMHLLALHHQAHPQPHYSVPQRSTPLSPRDAPPPYSATSQPTISVQTPARPSPSPNSIEIDPSTSMITFNTGPCITGSGNRYLLPTTPNAFTEPTPSSAATLAETTRLVAIFLAAIQRLNCGVAERNAQLQAQYPDLYRGEKGGRGLELTPFLKVNVVVNSGVTVVGDGNVVGLAQGAGRKRKRGGEVVGEGEGVEVKRGRGE
ncbi:Proline/serine-rich protein [Elsinoe australis]|uniref:Proline/serine-rich protein n=1 Tax=Elsinoe australis TaxID=40998 RepID=A0A2P7YNF7_9PEZI|nr:Proline/serine-rich protein [Elsinoe australis]